MENGDGSFTYRYEAQQGAHWFQFGPDSTPKMIAFSGEVGGNAWKPEDGTRTGVSLDLVEAVLGEPCDESMGETGTILQFATSVGRRAVWVGHGERTVGAHGWIAGGC